MARYQGNNTSVALPFDYVVMKYRQYFGLTWDEFLEIPPDVFFTDLEMMSVESEVEEAVAKSRMEEAKTAGARR